MKIDKYMKKFEYKDERISHLLAIFDDHVRLIRNYDDEFEMDSKRDDASMLAGFRNTGYGMLFALLQLGHITTADFHHRMHALNSTYFAKTGM